MRKEYTFRQNTGTSLWYALRQMDVEDGDSKIMCLTESRGMFSSGHPHDVAYDLYIRYLRRYKTLYADINEVNAKIKRRTRSSGNFMIGEHWGIGYIEINGDVFDPSWQRKQSGLGYEEYDLVLHKAVEKRYKVMQMKKFQKLVGDARTIAILIAENEGVLNGKARISRK